MYKSKILSVVLLVLAATTGHFEDSAFADQSKSLVQLLDESMLHRWSPAAAATVSDKIYEMEEHGETPDEATISKITALLESPDEQIAYAGTTAVVALGHHARPIRMDVWKLYFRIIDKDLERCKVEFGINPIMHDQYCFNRAFNVDESRFRICDALVSIGDIPSDEKSWSRCAGLSQ